MLTKADEGGRGVYEPPILADVICEQPLMSMMIEMMTLIEVIRIRKLPMITMTVVVMILSLLPPSSLNDDDNYNGD